MATANRQIPKTILAGDTLKLTINTTYSTDDYGVVLKFAGPSGAPIPYFFNATVENGSFVIHLAPSDTAAFQAGFYSYALIATDGTDEYTIEHGSFEVELRADLNFDSDLRSHARKVLDAIEAVIENRATTDVSSYTIAGRSLNRIPIDELLRLRSVYRNMVYQEEGKNRNKLKITMRQG
jgi:hypothetical protein